jgi:phosphatidate cytidylyltransferase
MIMDANMFRRVGFAAVAIPLALAVVWYGGLPLTALVIAVAMLGTHELFGLARRQEIRPSRAIGLLTAFAMPILTYNTLRNAETRDLVTDAWPYAIAAWLIVVLTWALVARAPQERPLSAVGTLVLAAAYTTGLPTFLLTIRHGQYDTRSWAGTWLVFFPLVVTWVCDSAAMFAGRAIGGPKLAPVVSPGKTRAGGIAGVAAGLAMAPLFGWYIFPEVGITPKMWQLFVIAGVLAVIGQVGDLAESLFKREAGVKDSSQLIPGHGGVLDRFDSLYFVIPTAAALYRLFGLV